jgi:D-alanyl-lipoteichoic acid acyltransferase DltB (MBOAT superfamily)
LIFSSLEYLLIFLPASLAGFLLLTRRWRQEFGWLVLCSLFFYGWWNPVYLWLLMGSMAFNYLVAWGISRSPRAGRALLAIGVTGNLAAIGWFKYAGFLVNNVNSLLGFNIEQIDVVLPLAISFFTFQQIAFLVDCRRGIAREYHVLDYALFVSFFPQLIAGPIVHHRDVIPQFLQLRQHRYDMSNLSVGLTALTVGLFKKVIIADGLAEIATPVFAAAEQGASVSAASAWLGALCYTFQLYFDFSGYSDMAIGSARLFGVRLPENFNSPYKSTSIIEFWRRWHITLSNFLRDYLYISLGGNRKGYPRQLVNLMITMLLGGLWHGAGWTFVFWGGLHGLYLVVNHLWTRYGGDLRAQWLQTRWFPVVAGAGTFVAVVIAWVWFRAETFGGARLLLQAMFNIPSLVATLPDIAADNSITGLALLLVAAGVAWWLPNTQEWMADANLVLAGTAVGRSRYYWRPQPRFALATAVLGAAALYKLVYMPNSISEFIYFQF